MQPDNRQNSEQFMRQTLELARRGWGRTNPNPLVGTVIVRDGQVIASGWHARLGGPHAERAALDAADQAGVDVRGATLYVNLEPCAHQGRTPPCTETIIRHGIREVVLAMADPNPRVAGQGIRQLEAAGVLVSTGVLANEARQLNEIFCKYITTGLPFLILKSALTLDGKIATATGDSRWVSGEASRRLVHQLRDRVAAVMVGSGTVLADDPALTTRLPEGKGRDPVRIVVDSRGRIPLTSRVVAPESTAGLILATTSRIDPDRAREFAARGVRVWLLDGPDGRVDLAALLRRLGGEGLDSVLLEGGGELNAAVLEAGLADKVLFFIAPRILGGRHSFTAVEGRDPHRMQEAWPVDRLTLRPVGEDWLAEGYPDGRIRQVATGKADPAGLADQAWPVPREDAGHVYRNY